MNPHAKDLTGIRFPVLDHGHVILLDVMGSDRDVLDAARTSYLSNKDREVPQSEVLGPDDVRLLRYLVRNRHTSPLESCTLKFHVKLPIFVERQWARHRTAGWNEVSARYSELPEEYYVPEHEDIQPQSGANKQGRSDTDSIPPGIKDDMVARLRSGMKSAFADYHKFLGEGVSREVSRVGLPLATYTEKVWWINLHNLLHFLSLRMDSHAQKEIRVYADVIGNEVVSRLFPVTWQAFLDYRLNALSLSAQDAQLLSDINRGVWNTLRHHLSVYGYVTLASVSPGVAPPFAVTKVSREGEEFAAKLSRLGVEPIWYKVKN